MTGTTIWRRQWAFVDVIRCAALVLALGVCVLSARSSARSSDNDGDGIDDDYEYALAERFRSYVHYPGDNACLDEDGSEKFLFRLRHPTYNNGVEDPNVIAINYVHLYRQDCGPVEAGAFGFTQHAGDDEPFVVFIRWNGSDWAFDEVSATAHWGAPVCEQLSSNRATNEVWVGRSKHGTYANYGDCGCSFLGVLPFEPCSVGGSDRAPYSVLYNVGEPGNWLTNDLGQVFAGWSGERVWDDPNGRFLEAGNIADELYLSNYLIVNGSPAKIACEIECRATYDCRHDHSESCLVQQENCVWNCGYYRWDSYR